MARSVVLFLPASLRTEDARAARSDRDSTHVSAEMSCRRGVHSWSTRSMSALAHLEQSRTSVSSMSSTNAERSTVGVDQGERTITPRSSAGSFLSSSAKMLAQIDELFGLGLDGREATQREMADGVGLGANTAASIEDRARLDLHLLEPHAVTEAVGCRGGAKLVHQSAARIASNGRCPLWCFRETTTRAARTRSADERRPADDLWLARTRSTTSSGSLAADASTESCSPPNDVECTMLDPRESAPSSTVTRVAPFGLVSRARRPADFPGEDHPWITRVLRGHARDRAPSSRSPFSPPARLEGR